MARLWLINDVFEEVRAEDNRQKRRRRRAIRLEFPPMHAEKDFVSLYRLTPALFDELLRDLTPLLGEPRRSDAISAETKVLTALGFYASGSYQRPIGQSVDLSLAQQTVSKCIRLVTEALNHPSIQEKYVVFPSTREDRKVIKQG